MKSVRSKESPFSRQLYFSTSELNAKGTLPSTCRVKSAHLQAPHSQLSFFVVQEELQLPMTHRLLVNSDLSPGTSQLTNVNCYANYPDDELFSQD